ncbi:nuclear factor of activated T-cells, cytoplasmic 3 isoform X2 [Pleurodeles waltl]|uniref:nuclear factor of activated T-cells, cytoplasmic 3 isoform X2 n=1 Tax=Pleurodeles waltl TaxID=8319 RepID=UPI003709B533
MLCAASADLEPDDCSSFYIFNVEQPQTAGNQPIVIPRYGTQSHCSTLSPNRFQGHKNYEGACDIPDSKYSPVGGPKPFECPSIQITSISPNCHQGIETSENELQANRPESDFMDRPSRVQLYLPLESPYRETSLSPSPGSSISSRSWFSDASSCESMSHIYDDVDSELNEAAARFTLGSPLASPNGSPRGCPGEESWQPPFGFGSSLSPRQSPCHSPRTSITDENWLSPRPTSRPSSRPTSPCGKRRHSSADICYAGPLSPHHSPTPSPGHSPRGSVTEETWLSTSLHAGQNLSPGLLQFQCCTETDIPLKTRKTSEDQTANLSGNMDPCSEDQGSLSPSLEPSVGDGTGSQHPLKKDLSGEQYLSVPSHFTWNKPKPGHTPIFRTTSLPPLDWPLPSHYGQCELKVEVQPKTHHRAHYETEGSRGAVKASTGGHPVVKLLGYNEKPVNLQMFIGTADDRYLRPHAFYQVHRITGKTVATASQEIVITSTKVLEIPLLPENNMLASIDCAGILKLRNSDIELRKGETDIGRKNTRVRLVFRVHIPQPSGKVLSLQVASIPVECSQRSAQELPQIDKYNINSCSVNGGQEMIINASNFVPESKIIFLEKGQGCASFPSAPVLPALLLLQSCQLTTCPSPANFSSAHGPTSWLQFLQLFSSPARCSSAPVLSSPTSQDGRPQWEVEGKIIREKCQGPTIVLEVPPYHNKTVTAAVQVQFYLCNGKRKRSQCQRFSYTPVLMKQEHREEVELPAVTTLAMPLSGTVQSMQSVRTHLPSPDTGNSCDNLLSTSSRSLVFPVPQHYPSVLNPSVPHLSHLQSRNIHPGAGCHTVIHQSFQATSAPPARPSYLPMQSAMYNGQHSLPMNSASSQGFDTVSFQQDSAVPVLINLGSRSVPSIQYHSSNSDSAAAGHQLAQSGHSGQSSLQPVVYHCSNTGHSSIPSPTTSQPIVQTSPQLQPVTYRTSNSGSASSPTATTSYPLVCSPLSEPSSPQLQTLPYQTPNSGRPTSSSSPVPILHSGQPSSQTLSPGLGSLSSATSLVHHSVSDAASVSTDNASLNIKSEPEDQELNFETIGLQDITLDDVNEIIGRDMSHGASVAAPSSHDCSGPLEAGQTDGV